MDPGLPPPTAITSPLMARDLGEAKNTTTSATSWALTIRPVEFPECNSSHTCDASIPRLRAVFLTNASVRSVSVSPGCTAVTLMPCVPNSSARFLVMATTATFRMLPTALPVFRAAKPLMLKMRPHPRLFMPHHVASCFVGDVLRRLRQSFHVSSQ